MFQTTAGLTQVIHETNPRIRTACRQSWRSRKGAASAETALDAPALFNDVSSVQQNVMTSVAPLQIDATQQEHVATTPLVEKNTLSSTLISDAALETVSSLEEIVTLTSAAPPQSKRKQVRFETKNQTASPISIMHDTSAPNTEGTLTLIAYSNEEALSNLASSYSSNLSAGSFGDLAQSDTSCRSCSIPVCRSLIEGWECYFHSIGKCKFAHPSDFVPVPKAEPVSKKHIICPSVFKAKDCEYGDKCIYAHEPRDLQVESCRYGSKCNKVVFAKGCYKNAGAIDYCGRKHPKETNANFIQRQISAR